MDISQLLSSPYVDFADALKQFTALIEQQEKLRRSENLDQTFCLQLFHGLSFVKYKRDCRTIDLIIDPAIERIKLLIDEQVMVWCCSNLGISKVF